MTRVRMGFPLAFRGGGGTVALALELLLVDKSFPVNAPLMTYGIWNKGIFYMD